METKKVISNDDYFFIYCCCSCASLLIFPIYPTHSIRGQMNFFTFHISFTFISKHTSHQPNRAVYKHTGTKLKHNNHNTFKTERKRKKNNNP